MKLQAASGASGFTLIELLIITGIMVLLVLAFNPLSFNFYTTRKLSETSERMLETLRTARDRSTMRVGNASHGVHVVVVVSGPDSYTLYEGNIGDATAVYATRDSIYDRTVQLDNVITLTTNLTGNDVSFTRGSGAPSSTGTITITDGTGATKFIDVNALGIATERATP